MFSIGIALHLLDRLSSPMKPVTQTMDSLSRSLKSLSASCDQFSRGFAVMTKTLEKARAPFTEIRNQADKLKDIGKSMALKGGASMMFGLAPSVDAAGFEKGMAEVATLTDMGIKEFHDKYGKQIIDLSVDLGQDPALVVRGMYQAISAGVDPKEAVEFMRKSGQAAIAGVSDIFTSTDLSTSIKNAFNVPMSEMGGVNDIIFQTVRKGKTTYTEIAGSFSQVGASAASAGISLEHVQAAVAQMTLGGVKTERAYTSLKYAIDALVAPSDSAKKAFAKLGLEVNAETVRQKDLMGVMDELMQAMSGLSENEQAELISDIFGSQEAQMFVKDFGTNTEKYKAMLKDIKNSTGVTNEAYKKMAETSAHQFEKVKQSFKAIRIAAGATILPVINVMLGAIKSILTPIANFAQRHKLLSGILLGGAIAISAVVAALGVLSIAVGMAIKGYTNMRIAASLFTTHKWRMITAVKSMTAALLPNIKAMVAWTANIARVSFAGMLSGLKAVAVSIRAFSLSAIAGIRAVSIAMLTAPVGWIIMGVSALVGAGYLLYKNWDKVSKALSGAWSWLKENWKKVLNVFLRVNPITAPVMALNKLVKFVFGMNLFEAGKKILQTLYQGMMSFINKPVEAIKGLVQKMRNLLPFSPAKEGPFRDLHKIRIIETIAETIKPTPVLTAMGRVMSATRQAILPSIGIQGGRDPRIQGGVAGSVTVNYNPTITINGASAQAKEDFAAMLKKHQHELMKLIQDAQAKNMRLAY
jgi:TP901 family phage tail tape measure protein